MEGTANTEDRSGRTGPVLRAFGLTVAVILAAVAVWLIVTGGSQKRIEIGVLAGLWGLLLGAFATFGGRHHHRELDPLYQPNHIAQPPSTALVPRPAAALEREADQAERRAFEARLYDMLHSEVHSAVSREMGSVRQEIAAMRSDLLEKVGGELRLERIETTRIIGSDIEALQRAIDQLKLNRPATSLGSAHLSLGSVESVSALDAATVEPAAPSPQPAPAILHAVEPPVARPARPDEPQPGPAAEPARPQPAPPVVAAPGPARPVAAEPAPTWSSPPPSALAPPPAAAPAPTVVQASPAPAPAAPAPAAASSAAPAAAATNPPAPSPAQPRTPERPGQDEAEPVDPFAGLPRIRRFTDFELDPIEPPAYTGRRRAGAFVDAEAAGRRHRRDDTAENVLARILQRESSS